MGSSHPHKEYDIDGYTLAPGVIGIGVATWSDEHQSHVCLADVSGALCIVSIYIQEGEQHGQVSISDTGRSDIGIGNRSGIVVQDGTQSPDDTS